MLDIKRDPVQKCRPDDGTKVKCITFSVDQKSNSWAKIETQVELKNLVKIEI